MCEVVCEHDCDGCHPHHLNTSSKIYILTEWILMTIMIHHHHKCDNFLLTDLMPRRTQQTGPQHRLAWGLPGISSSSLPSAVSIKSSLTSWKSFASLSQFSLDSYTYSCCNNWHWLTLPDLCVQSSISLPIPCFVPWHCRIFKARVSPGIITTILHIYNYINKSLPLC